MSAGPDRPLRADARLNHDRLLEVAAQAFARDGDGATMKEIARAAGVGVGTLYRRFPTREDLIEATYRSETARLAQAAADLLDTYPAVGALRRWMDLFVAYLTTKHGMGAALAAILTDDGDRMRTRYLLADALALFLARGATEGTLRTDIAPYDLLLAIGGVVIITSEPGQAATTTRLLTLLLDGLRPAP